jgi:hypothetical protein
MQRRKTHPLTLGDVIQVVSKFSHDDHEVSLVVADLVNRRLIQSMRTRKRLRVVVSDHR